MTEQSALGGQEREETAQDMQASHSATQRKPKPDLRHSSEEISTADGSRNVIVTLRKTRYFVLSLIGYSDNMGKPGTQTKHTDRRRSEKKKAEKAERCYLTPRTKNKASAYV